MNRRRAGAWSVVFALFFVTLMVAAVPVGPWAPSAASPPRPSFSGHSVVAASKAELGAPIPPVHPGVVCPPLYPTYGMVGGVWAITPEIMQQGPCPPIEQDEVHLSFFSNVSGSGENVRVPLHLPNVTGGIVSDAVGGVYVGMVMRGDPYSPWGQSYAMVDFEPDLTDANYTEDLGVLSIINASFFGGGCPGIAMNFTWNGTYWCEVNELGRGSGVELQGNIAGGTFVNVTFQGVAGSGLPAQMWSNTSSPSTNSTWTFNASMDDGGSDKPLVVNTSFYPAYRTSCPLSCVLNWSMPFGLGFGADICPFASNGGGCNSYNEYTWIGINPVEIGSPEFAVDGNYTGDFTYIAPESASGACNTVAPALTVAVCINFNVYGGTGYYPIFTFNGTVLNFGTNYTWTTEDFGGVNLQYLPNADSNLLIPFFEDRLANDSRAGFIGPNLPLNVSVRLQDLGRISASSLTYSVGGGSPVTVPLVRVNGTNSSGYYNASVPTSAGNGRIAFFINATNGAGVVIGSPTEYVERGPLPTFDLSILTDPAGCGYVSVNGTKYYNGAVVPVLPGFYPAQGIPCYPYVFSNWVLTPGVSFSPLDELSGTLAVSANGTVNATFLYVRPLDRVLVETNPGNCGSVLIDGNAYTNGTNVSLLDSLIHIVLVNSTCANDPSFAGWTFSGPFSLLGYNFTPMGNGTLVANFLPAGVAHTIVFYTSPTDCGGVQFQGAGYTDGQAIDVALGEYSVSGIGCPGFGFRNLSSSSGIGLVGSTADVSAAGWIRATMYSLTEVRIATSPSDCGTVTFDGTVYHNGAVVIVANNSTHDVVATPCSGFTLFGLNTTGGLSVYGDTLTANASGTVTAVFQAGGASAFVAFLTSPSSCGTIYMNGLTYHDSNFTQVAPGSVYPISVSPCTNYGFVGWTITSVSNNGIAIVGGNVYINASGSITADFQPLVQVILYTDPATCGTILLGGLPYTNNGVATVTSYLDYPLAAVPCAHNGLADWLNTSGAELHGAFVEFTGAAILTAQFAPAHYALSVEISPSDCGLLHIGTNVAQNGSVLGLTYGNYTVVPNPCPGDHLVGYQTSGSVAVNGSELFVQGVGNLTAIFRPVPPTVTLSVSSSTLVGDPVNLLATVGTLVPPFNYTYNWSFGDGTTLSTIGNATTHTYHSAGMFTVEVTVIDPLGRHASANETISVETASVGTGGIPWTDIAIAVGVLAAILAVVLVGALLRRRKGPPPAEGGEGALPEPSGPVEIPAADSPALPGPPET